MQIQISDHGRQRLKERTDVSDRKLEKLVAKAWASTEPVPDRWRQKFRHSQDGTIFKFCLGTLFIFHVYSENTVCFKTVLSNRGRDIEYWSELNKRHYERHPEEGLKSINKQLSIDQQ
jgi:hypothetical protein